MTRLSRLFPRSHARVVVYLALTVVFLLLSYQLVLNRNSSSSVSRWTGDGLHAESGGTAEPSKELVVAAMRTSDMSWLQENVPDWHANIYRADMGPDETNLTVPMNKGNEAMVYLTYLIDRYESLPDVTVFMHHGRYQWHNDNPMYDSVIFLKDLQLHYVQKAGYVNMRCAWLVGCPVELKPVRYLHERPDDFAHPTAMMYPDSFTELFPDEELPEIVGTPCCSQFAVSRNQVHQRKRADYVRMRQWLIDSKLDPATSGRIIEYSWHMVFGKPSQFCPEPADCYCNTYGYCHMSEEDLARQWVWRGLELPPGWPETADF